MALRDDAMAMDALCQDLVTSPRAEMSVVLVPARNIPLALIANEYDKVRASGPMAIHRNEWLTLPSLLPSLSLPSSLSLYQILRRRVAKLSGGTVNAEDGAHVAAFLGFLTKERFPAASVVRGSIRKGTVLTFRKEGHTITAQADGEPIGAVQSARVCAAFLDMYAGSQPVHEGARRDLQISALQIKHGAKRQRSLNAMADRPAVAAAPPPRVTAQSSAA